VLHHFRYDGQVWLICQPQVPVPGAVWLMASGLLGFIGVRRRKA
jgi:poly-beta-hydroxyalkanoate depolymerase